MIVTEALLYIFITTYTHLEHPAWRSCGQPPPHWLPGRSIIPPPAPWSQAVRGRSHQRRWCTKRCRSLLLGVWLTAAWRVSWHLHPGRSWHYCFHGHCSALSFSLCPLQVELLWCLFQVAGRTAMAKKTINWENCITFDTLLTGHAITVLLKA